MINRTNPDSPILAVVCLIHRSKDILLIKRGRKPNKGLWALPGGLVELGEPLQEAVIREVHEESNLTIQDPEFLQYREIIDTKSIGTPKFHYVLMAFKTSKFIGTAKAGDDASDVCWFNVSTISELSIVDGLTEILEDSGLFI